MVDIGLTNLKKEDMECLFKSNFTYSIPHFQREFSWTKDDWEDFFEDILKSMDKNEGHFFGFMTFNKSSEGEIEIIEGQQRLTIVTILICIIRDMLYKFDKTTWKQLDSKYIRKDDVLSMDTSYDFKLRLSDMNRSFFVDYIQKEGGCEEKIQKINSISKINPSNKLIKECYLYLYKRLTERLRLIKDKEQKKPYLLKIIKTVLRNFIIVNTEVTNRLSAYNIFQTLNDRGLELTLSDLLKMYLFEIVGEDGKNAKDRWDEIREILGNLDISTFLRHYWLSTKGVIKENDLLHELTKTIKIKEEVFKFLEEIKFEAEVYEGLFNPTKDFFWSDEELINLLGELRILITHQSMPILMAGYHLGQREFKKLINACICFTFRYLTIAEAENKVVERLFSDIAIKIRDKKINKTEEVIKLLNKHYIEDSVFCSLFEKKTIKKSKLIRYTLEKIENSIDDEKEKFSERITVEHILPKNLNEEWKEYIEKNNMDKDELVHRLGNMTLLLGKVNRRAQNDFFIKKRDLFYKKMTKLKINEPLKSISSWTSEDINERQGWLAKYAKDIWKI